MSEYSKLVKEAGENIAAVEQHEREHPAATVQESAVHIGARRVALAVAQVKATLALAEQQRIANEQSRAGNLIACMSAAANGVAQGIHSVSDYLLMWQKVNPEIMRILGLEKENDGR